MIASLAVKFSIVSVNVRSKIAPVVPTFGDQGKLTADAAAMLGLAPDTNPTEQGAQVLAAVQDDALVQDVLDAVRDHPTFDAWIAWRDAFLANKPNTRVLRTYLDQARSIKSAAELALLQTAVDITALALTSSRKFVAVAEKAEKVLPLLVLIVGLIVGETVKAGWEGIGEDLVV